MIAAAQAALPKSKCRFWSRPLVALLFLLQPIERGLARYKWRWNIHSRPRRKTIPLESRQDIPGPDPDDTISYWSCGGVTRYSLLSGIVSRLAQEGWQNKTDSGWSSHDMEIFGNRWSRLCLTTVTEELDQDKRNFHCRLDTVWSLRAKMLFWFVFGVELILIPTFARVQPWLWMLLLDMALVGWFLEHQCRSLHLSVTALLDEVARQSNLIRIDRRTAKQKTAPPSGQSFDPEMAARPAQG
jgi:hypothetical protein